MEERIDIYDSNRHLTGKTIARSDAFLREGEFMLYALAVIFDTHGKLLITQRVDTKHWAPGCWEVPGGGVLAGETSAQAVVREVREEVGLDVSDCVTVPFFTYENVDLKRGDNYIVDMYRFELDITKDDIVLQTSEAKDCTLASWDEIEALAANNAFLHFERLRTALKHAQVL